MPQSSSSTASSTLNTEPDAASAGGPLAGRRIAITRAPDQAAGLTQALEALGARVTPLAAIAIVPIEDNSPLDAAIDRLASYDWLVFTSVNGVLAFAGRLAATGHVWGDRGAARVAAIGPATARALAELSVAVDLLPDAYVAEGILATLVARGEIASRRFLLPRADIARETLAQELRRQGAQVDEIAAYRTVASPVPAGELRRALNGDERVDAITFTSSSTVRGFLQGVERLTTQGQTPAEDIPTALRGVALAAIGPITAATLREHQLEPAIIADEYTIPGLVRALVAYFAPSPPMTPDLDMPPNAGEGAAHP